jgi:cytochrome c nitrite reductase small subunit
MPGTRLTRSRRTLFAGLAISLTIGVAAGLVGFTFVYAKGLSYFRHEPEVCANCHVMQGHFDAWSRSSHHAVAVCVDCHMPHNFAAQMALKAYNGYRHTKAFTSGRYPDVLTITPINHAVTERQCRFCHQSIVQAIDAAPGFHMKLECIRCHASVGHLE